MKYFITLLLTLSCFFSFGQDDPFEKWQFESQNDKRMLPKYGGIEKTKSELEADSLFVNQIMATFESKLEASNHMVDLGFQYLYKRDPKTAMNRFNQAYLLKQDNPQVFWGYGAIYMNFGKFDLSRDQYNEGLKLDPKNDDILIDYGTTYLGEFYKYYEAENHKAQEKLDLGIEKLQEAYSLNPKNPNASYKLSICYFYKKNCDKAKSFLKVSEDLGNANITDSYRNELKVNCLNKNLDCSSIKLGKFKIEDDLSGTTIIVRNEKFQIEENKEHNFKLKLKVNWLDNCTYQLTAVEDLVNPNAELPEMVLTCTITEITENGYVQISSSNVSGLTLEKEVIRID